MMEIGFETGLQLIMFCFAFGVLYMSFVTD